MIDTTEKIKFPILEKSEYSTSDCLVCSGGTINFNCSGINCSKCCFDPINWKKLTKLNKED